MPVQFTFLVLPHVHLMDLAGPDQVLLEAIGFGADWRVEYCSFSPELVSSAGMPLGTVKHFNEISLQPGDYLLVPGADVSYMMQGAELKAQTDMFDWMREAYANGVNVCSICTGAYVLALSGILNGKECTTHWKRTQELQKYFPELQVIENVLFTEQDRLYTSAGVAAGIDMSLHIVEQMQGEYFAHKVARELVIYNRRSGRQSQHSIFLNYRNHIHSGIHAVQDWLQEHLDRKNALPELADIACMSERNFTRIFKKETGLTVNAYITLLRKEKLRKLLKNPDLTRIQLARACGLDSERQLSRLLQSL